MNRRSFLSALICAPLVPVAAIVKPTPLVWADASPLGETGYWINCEKIHFVSGIYYDDSPLSVTWSLPHDPTAWSTEPQTITGWERA